jgi:hypothetical protein
MRRKPRFLAPQGRSGDGRGYLNMPLRALPPDDSPETAAEAKRVAEAAAMCDEPEAVGPAILDAFGESARYYETLRHQANIERARVARQELNVEQRLRGVEERAKRQHINVSGELHVIRSMLERAKSGGRKEPPAAVDRLERIEAVLDGIPLAA